MATIKKRIGKKQVTWRIDYYDPQGKRVRKDFDLKKEAEAYLGKVLAAKKQGRYHDVFDIKKESLTTCKELVERYEEIFRTQKSFISKSSRLKILTEYFGNRLLAQINYLDLELFRNKRKATPARGGKTRADASVNREMSLVSHLFNKAVEWEMLEASPLKKGKRLFFRENNQRLRFLSDGEVEALLKACLPHLRPIVEVALLTGMRRGELLGLKWEQIRNGFIYLTETKSGKARQIPINDRLAEVFREVRRDNQLKSPYVFCDSKGRRFFEVKRSFPAACRRAGIEDFRFHDLRHTFASHLVMKGVSLKAVQELLGHADLTMTMRYAHLSKAHLQEAVATLNGLGGKSVGNTFRQKIMLSCPKKEVGG